jgi:predicted small lipoprotein YifL
MTSLIRALFAVTLLAIFSAGCATRGPVVYKPAPLTAEERQEIQTRVIEADFDTVYAATIAVLQDEGWDIQDVKKESGVIQALTKRRQSKLGPDDDWKAGTKEATKEEKKSSKKKSEQQKLVNEWTRWEKLTAHIESWGEKAKNRISITKFGALPAITYTYPVGSGREMTVNSPAKEDQVVDEDPLTYSRLFARIEQAVADRKKAVSEPPVK